MKRKISLLVAALFTISLPLATSAAMHEHGKTESMEHGSMQGMEHGEHGKMMEGMLMIGEQTVDGVKAMAHLKDVKAAMGKMGMKETHHFAVMFEDSATGKSIESGTVALKIKSPSGQEGEAVRLMGMQGHFGADIVLAEKGAYTFTLGTKVAGEKKRQFEFTYEVK